MTSKKTLEDALAAMEATNAQAAELKAEHAPELEASLARLKVQAARLATLPQDQRRQVLDDAGLKNVSAAPKPVTPIQGLSRIEPLPQVPPPKWEKWRHMRDVELWEAVALSVNLEPDELPVYLGAYDRFGDNPFKICPSEFLWRLQIANSNGGNALPIKPVHTLKARCLVDLPTFGAWASSLWRDLPVDFPVLTNTPPEDDSARRDFLAWMNLENQKSPEYQAQYAKTWESLVTADDIEKTIVESEATPASDWGQRERKEQLIAALKAKRNALLASVVTGEALQQATEPHGAPVVATSASGDVEPAKGGPLPLTTSEIAFCFAGLRWKTEDAWKKPLGDKPKWLQACIAIPGVRGVSETRWNPVYIGAALVRGGHANARSIRAKFQIQPLLKPWHEEWKTYEDNNISTE